MTSSQNVATVLALLFSLLKVTASQDISSGQISSSSKETVITSSSLMRELSSCCPQRLGQQREHRTAKHSTNCRTPLCPPTPSALVCNGYCTTRVCHRCMPTGTLWHSLCYTDAAQGPAHRWWVAGMEGGSNHCALLPGNTYQEAHGQNQVQSSVLADGVRLPLRLYGPVRPHSNAISIPNIYMYLMNYVFMLPSILYSLSSLGQDRILWDALQGDRMGPNFVRDHNSMVTVVV